VPGVRRVDDPFAHGRVVRYDETTAPYLSDDLDAVLVVVTLEKGLPAAERALVTREVSVVLDTVAPGVPGTRGLVGSKDDLIGTVTRLTEQDVRTGEALALPVTLLVMVFVFGGLLAAGLPLAGGVAAIASALGCLLAFSYVMELDPVVVNVVSVLGLGLCIDYGLLLVSRYREEARRQAATARRGAGALCGAAAAALRAAVASAGRTILFSGLTIAIAPERPADVPDDDAARDGRRRHQHGPGGDGGGAHARAGADRARRRSASCGPAR
jgi:RND superfamily putative drug exporter